MILVTSASPMSTPGLASSSPILFEPTGMVAVFCIAKVSALVDCLMM